MNRRLIRKIFKIIGWTLLILIAVLFYLIYAFTSPSSDAEIFKKFEGDSIQPVINYEVFKGKRVRVIGMQKEIDSLLPILFFVIIYFETSDTPRSHLFFFPNEKIRLNRPESQFTFCRKCYDFVFS